MLKEKRTQAGLSQKDLAEKAGISAEYLCKIEKKEPNISKKIMEALASALNTTVPELFYTTE